MMHIIKEFTDKLIAANWRRIGKYTAASFVLLLASLGAGLFYLDTDSGQKKLVSWINGSFEDKVVLEPVTGSLFSVLTLPSIKVYDHEGLWLELQQTHINWSPLQLFKSRIALSQMDAEKLLFHRLPVKSARDKDADRTIFQFPVLPVDVEISSFAIQKIQISKAFLGKTAEFISNGDIKLTRKEGILANITLASTRKDANKNRDEIILHLAYPGDGHDLLADLQIRAAKEGIFTKFVGMNSTHDVEAYLKGSGPLDNWSGIFTARVGNTAIADATIRYTDHKLSLRAQLEAGDLMPDTGTALLGRSARLSLDLKPTPNFDRAELALDLIADTLHFKAKSVIAADDSDPGDQISFSLEVIDSRPFNRILIPAYFAPFKIDGTLSDLTHNPKVVMTINGLRMGYADNGEARVTGKIEASSSSQDFQVTATGHMDEITGDSFSKVRALVNPGFDWSLKGSHHPETGLFAIDRLALNNDLLKIEGKGEFTSRSGAFVTNIKTAILDISTLIPDISGKMNITTDLSRAEAENPLLARVEARLHDLNLGAEIANEFIGSSPSLAAHLNRTDDGVVTVENIAMTAQHLSLNARGQLSADQNLKTGEFKLAFFGLETLKSLERFKLDGGLDITGQLSGPLSSPSITLETALKQFDVQNLSLQNFTAQMNADDIFNTAKGSLTLNSDSNYGPLSGKALFTTPGNAIYKISDIDLSLGKYHTTGALEATAGKPVTGRMAITTANSDAINTPIGGIIAVDIWLSDKSGKQEISLTSELTDLSLPLGQNEILTLQAGKISGAALFHGKNPEVTLKADFSNLAHPHLQAKEAQISLGQDEKGMAYNFHILGTNIMPFELTGDGILSPPEIKGRYLSLGLDGTIDHKPVKLTQPLNLYITNDGFSLDSFELLLGDGHIKGDLKFNKNEIMAKLNATKADLRPFMLFDPGIFLTGILDGSLNLVATPKETNGSFSLKLAALHLNNKAVELDPRIILFTEGQVTGDSFTFSSRAHLTDIFTTHLSATLPLHIDVASSRLSLPDDQPIKGELVWQGDIGPIWPTFNLVNHDLGGKVNVKLLVGGTMDNPDIDGHFNLTQGRYEILRTGFVAADIDLTATIKDRHLTLDHLTANDGAKGRITATADINLLPDQTYNAKAQLDISNAYLFRQPQLEIMASTNLTFLKTRDHSSLKGDVTIENANIGAIKGEGPEILELDVQEINGPDKNSQTGIKTGSHLGPFPLDLTVKAPGRFFIRSYGLDSEWTANLIITGTTDKPVITGSAALIRGIFDFSGKRFKLTNGKLDFPLDNSNDPLLNISAEHELRDLTAVLNITGRASAPILKVTSIPQLPQDEILSRILFGTSVTELSAIEAIQLAATVHSLSNGGGPGLIGGVRNALGFDRLSIDKEEGGVFNTIITGGKYLTENIYIEVTTAPTSGQTSTSVEVNLSGKLSLITQQTPSQGKSLALRWSWKY